VNRSQKQFWTLTAKMNRVTKCSRQDLSRVRIKASACLLLSLAVCRRCESPILLCERFSVTTRLLVAAMDLVLLWFGEDDFPAHSK
jgi:hypothetical protein